MELDAIGFVGEQYGSRAELLSRVRQDAGLALMNATHYAEKHWHLFAFVWYERAAKLGNEVARVTVAEYHRKRP